MALSVRQLNALACLDPDLRRLFQGVYPSNRLPDHPSKTTIVNTDPAGEPGQHWLGVWRENQVCEVFGGAPTDRLRGAWLSRVDHPALEVRGAQRQDPAIKRTTAWPVATMPSFTCKNDCAGGPCWSLWRRFGTTITFETIIAWGNAYERGFSIVFRMP